MAAWITCPIAMLCTQILISAGTEELCRLVTSNCYPVDTASYFKGQAVQEMNCLTLEIGPIDYPETSVNNRKFTPRNVPEERRSRSNSGGSLKYVFFLN